MDLVSKEQVTRCNASGCGRTKGESNHWIEIQVIVWADGPSTVLLGSLLNEGNLTGNFSVEYHDLCGESCFHKHISALLKLPNQTEKES